MISSTNRKDYLGICVMLFLALAVGPGCQEAKPPPSPKAAAFSREVQSVINRIAPPLAGPVAQKDRKADQKALEKVFSLCAEECQDMFYYVFILDQQGVLTALYPPAEVNKFQFSNYKGVQKAFAEKKPNQTALYKPNGTLIYIIYVPLIHEGHMVGIVAFGLEENKVLEEGGLSEKEFLALDFKTP
ncbi:MAG: hypothetical protein P8X65_13770 [Syntrophobacterales bacterium]|jgi:hypothetical protein